MKGLSSLLAGRPVIVSLICVLALFVIIAGATKMRLATGNETLMSTSSKVYQDNQELEKYFGGESIILLNTSDRDYGILTADNLRRMKELDDTLKQYDKIYSFISPANVVEQLMSRMTPPGLPGSPGLPRDPNMLNKLLYDQGKLRPVFDELVLDNKHSLIMIKLKGEIGDWEKDKVMDAVKQQLKNSPFEGVDTIVSGKPVMDSAVHASMQSSMKKMIGIAIIVMLIVLMLVFHVRWRVIALPVILLSVIATLGLMGYVNVPMTMVSMAVFPILIGLGVDYAIQFQNRYEEESKLSLSNQGGNA